MFDVAAFFSYLNREWTKGIEVRMVKRNRELITIKGAVLF